MATLGHGAARARSSCRVHWRLGQALLPEHFQRQELGLARELELRFAQLAPPGWGVAQLEWDAGDLAAGMIRISQLVAILPRGRVVDVPGNARAISLDLKTVTGDRVVLYAHLLSEPVIEKLDDQARDLEAVELVIDRLKLSTAPSDPDAMDSLELARLVHAADGTWELAADYVPPLIALAAWPGWFEALLARLRRLLAGWEEILLGDLQSYVLSVEKSLRARECLRRSRLASWFLVQIDAASPARGNGPSHHDSVLAAHPFELFRRVVELYLDVHGYQSAPADLAALAGQVYDHRDIVGCFEPLLAELELRTRLPYGRAPYAAFARDGRLMACALPTAIADSKLYWLVRRGIGVDADALRGIKLAARSRLETVHRHALRGVTVRPLASVPFRHDFDPDVEFYEILAEGDEWTFVRREGAIAYVAEGAIVSCETYLFWRDV